MALRPSKISSELIQTCNKYISRSAGLRTHISANLEAQQCKEPVKAQQNFRYKISNVTKPPGVPLISFKEESTTLFADLQPSAKPEFKFDFSSPKWAEKATNNSPFPSNIRQKNRLHVAYTDQQKAEDKLLKYKMSGFSQSRNYSTTYKIPKRFYTYPADNTGSSDCGKKIDKCAFRQKVNNCKVVNKNCPKFKLPDCEQSKGSNCTLNYLDTNCTKKFAPYPSYSEACAEALPEDPSECEQCPWRSCDAADSIEPGKPVRNKRNYSTSARHLGFNTGVVVGPTLPPPQVVEVMDLIYLDKCNKQNIPCKPPPGPCEVRKQKEDELRREKEIRIPPKPKKASEEINRMVLSDAAIIGDPSNSLRLNIDQIPVGKQSSWTDIEVVDMLLDKKQKWPNCNKRKKPKRPDEKAPRMLAAEGMFLDKKPVKGDEGHPPPCCDDRAESLNCPEKPIKKPKYRKRPMNRGYYKKPEDPYNKSNGS
ncbi:uncharacterized protein LOC126740263 isoform X2 [Anthonomus grandis grandis]|uniref:uncharacterized protein LOC126740263 isoform X2 n=1 Tax=Anthonomus grandis grandis TaxID=2921223 RepID=UPI002165A361|nr:uncharacterized protein LOC126740263 isoform X2 [Anthonomus grandis grandis]